MKQLTILTALALMLAVAPAFAAGLQVSETLIDYGTIKEGPPVVKTILLTNIGNAPLEIANVASS